MQFKCLLTVAYFVLSKEPTRLCLDQLPSSTSINASVCRLIATVRARYMPC